jgi:solute carrier family 35 (UDP-galactose transporter), member B1
MVCGNMALRWISYPTQVIAKSSKPIPVMILGVFLAHKRYTIQKYLFVLMIVVGVVLFIYDGDKAGKAKDKEEANSHLGLLFIGLSLLADGVLGGIEDRMREKTKPTALNFMFKINAFTAMFLIVGTIATGEMKEFIEFATKYPDLYTKIALAALSGSMGQIFIFMMISEFGPLPCSITTTLRKFFTVIISVIFMGNPLSLQQSIATAIVFAALFADALWGKKQLCGKPQAQAVPTEEPDVEKNGQILDKTDVELQNLKGKDKE